MCPAGLSALPGLLSRSQAELGQPLSQGWEEEAQNGVTSCGCAPLCRILF